MACTHHTCLHIVPVFSGLDEQQMNAVNSIIREKNFSSGELLFKAGEPNGSLIVVHTGQVKVYRLDSEGREQVLRIISPGEFTGEFALFSDEPVEDYAQAVGDCSVCMIGGEKMRDLMEQTPSIALKITQELSRRLSHSDAALHSIVTGSVEQRIATYLARLSEKQRSDEVNLPVTKGTVASMLGTSQETLSRRLAMLQEEAVIRLGRGKAISILDKEALLAKSLH
ncbi:MAG: Crp/Fnr family transcriptional regulator [Spirochaetota bacterium]